MKKTKTNLGAHLVAALAGLNVNNFAGRYSHFLGGWLSVYRRNGYEKIGVSSHSVEVSQEEIYTMMTKEWH